MTIQNLPLVGFLGLKGNRGPVRYKDSTPADFTDNDIQATRQQYWSQLKRGIELRSHTRLPEAVEQLTREILQGALDRDQSLSGRDKNFYMRTLIGDASYLRRYKSYTLNRAYERARELFDTFYVITALVPISNLRVGIRKIIIGIADDGSSYGVIEKDRGWKFKATLIAVGIAEICFLGLIVHGIATLYFAMTSLEAQPAQA